MKKLLPVALVSIVAIAASVPAFAANAGGTDALAEDDVRHIAEMPLDTTDPEMQKQILEARNEIIFSNSWSADGVEIYVGRRDGTTEKASEFSELFPNWDIPTVKSNRSVESEPALLSDEAPAELTPCVTLFNDTAYAARSGAWTSVEFSAASSNGSYIRYWHKNDTGEKVKVYLYRTDRSITTYVSSMIVEGHGQNSEVYCAPTAGSGTYTIVIEAYVSGGAIEGDVVVAQYKACP